uniref:G protein-coupled receptor n=1 Tax=Steinernema glaseri TaxID=37863 RepID=A0A1I8ATQ9_9BILA
MIFTCKAIYLSSQVQGCHINWLGWCPLGTLGGAIRKGSSNVTFHIGRFKIAIQSLKAQQKVASSAAPLKQKMSFQQILALVQFVLTLSLCFLTITVLVSIFRKTPLAVLYSRSPIVGLIIGMNLLYAVALLPGTIFWGSFVMDFMDRGRETGRVLVSSFIFTGCLSVFHDSLSIGIFLERVYCVLCPFRAIHWRVKIVVGGLVLFLTTVNLFVRFLFFARCLLETAPFFVDLGGNVMLDFNAAYYLGAYGVLSWTLEMTACTFAYKLIVEKKTDEEATDVGNVENRVFYVNTYF